MKNKPELDGLYRCVETSTAFACWTTDVVAERCNAPASFSWNHFHAQQQELKVGSI